MGIWNFDPTQYQERTFELIPAGDHRARIKEVLFKTFNSGNQGYEITLQISGYYSTVRHYLVLNPADPAKTNQAIGAFFDAFGIQERELGNGANWVGKGGAVRIRHEEYNGENRARVAYCISKARQDSLPAWKEMGNTTSAPAAPAPNGFAVISDNQDLPF